MKEQAKVPMKVFMTRSSTKCPVCGKKFFYDPEHAYLIGFGRNGYGGKKVCSYACMRNWEKENHIKRRDDRL